MLRRLGGIDEASKLSLYGFTPKFTVWFAGRDMGVSENRGP